MPSNFEHGNTNISENRIRNIILLKRFYSNIQNITDIKITNNETKIYNLDLNLLNEIHRSYDKENEINIRISKLETQNILITNWINELSGKTLRKKIISN